jgi:voltage-gated potassium channel
VPSSRVDVAGPSRSRRAAAVRPTRRFAAAILSLTLIVAVGTAGYALLEHLPLGQAAYLTIITLTTVGYGDLVPHTPAGQVFTVVLILTGLGTVLYLASVGAEMVIEGHLRDLLGRNVMQRRIDALKDHVIVCGYGRFGRVVTDELRRNDADVVVVDSDPGREPDLKAADVPYEIGSALHDEVLERAGLRRAKAIVIATPSDPDNVFITLSVREKSKTIRIHSRGESEAGLRRLELAGANQALSAYQSGGLRMASSILRPSVVDFLELSLPGHHEDVALEEMRVDTGSRLVGRTVADVEGDWPRLRIVGLRRGNDALRVVPEPPTRLEADDLLVVIGEGGALRRLGQESSG